MSSVDLKVCFITNNWKFNNNIICHLLEILKDKNFLAIMIIVGSMAEWSVCRTHNLVVPLWSLTQLDFKSLAILVNSQLVASCQLGFLILLRLIDIIFELFVSNNLSGMLVN